MSDEVRPELKLPRPLVNQLLHIAQSASVAIRWGFIGAREQTPTRCYPIEKLDANGIAAVQRTLDQQGDSLFALYRIDSGEARVPDLSEIESLGIKAPLLLGISLGTRGVLQLHGWHVSAGQPTELDVGISES